MIFETMEKEKVKAESREEVKSPEDSEKVQQEAEFEEKQETSKDSDEKNGGSAKADLPKESDDVTAGTGPEDPKDSEQEEIKPDAVRPDAVREGEHPQPSADTAPSARETDQSGSDEDDPESEGPSKDATGEEELPVSSTKTAPVSEESDETDKPGPADEESKKEDPHQDEAKDGDIEDHTHPSTDPPQETDKEAIPEAAADDSKQEDVSEKEGVSEEESEESEASQEEQFDFDEFGKQECVDFVVELNKETDMRRVDRLLKEIKPRYDEIFHAERELRLKKFLEEEGNEEADFEFKGDELDERFNDYYDLLRDKRNHFYSDLEKQKEENLQKKNEILDKIRELVDGEETNFSIGAVRSLQDEWKKIGPVPASQNKLLWANYNALLDRYYDARSIYFELKDLDRKKNLELKLELCQKAEALDAIENIKDAIHQLNELHDEFKNIGPVPREEQESIWIRFKTASDKIYLKRKSYVEDLKKNLQENMESKLKMSEEVQAFGEFTSDRITEWNSKTKELLELQKKWESIGGMPRDKAKEINKRFWSGFKTFFNNKNAFFKQFESQRDDNLKLKEELIARAEALKESTDWEQTANEFKELQQKWKDIGPVPEKLRNEVYQKFKAACDHFFDQRRAQNQQQNKEYDENYKKKLELCDELEKMSGEATVSLDNVYDLIDQYMDIGFVPRGVIKKMHARFDGVVNKLMECDALTDEDKSELKINIQINRMKGSSHGDHKLQRKENALKRRITNLENDINTYKTNMEYFASSKTADAMKSDFNDKIEKANKELADLKKQLKLLRNA